MQGACKGTRSPSSSARLKEAHELHQVADKLLHLCIHITDIPDSMNGIQDDVSKPQQEYRSTIASTRIDPQILCAVATDDVELSEADIVDPADAATPGINGENPPLVAVDAVLSLLETSYEAANTTLVFRHVRWFAALVDLPRNANALGERAVSLFLQVLATTSSSDTLLFAFLAKSIHVIVLQNSAALEVSLSETTGDLETTTADTDTFFTDEKLDQTDETKCVSEIEKLCKLEWIDEYEEETAFESKPLTEILHNIDVWLAVAEALAALANAFLKWNPSDSGSTATDFSELMAAKLGSHQVSPGKPEIHATGGSKKKLPADPGTPSAVGEAVMLSLLEKGLQVPKLISQYTAVNPAVCVSLLGLLDNLMTVPSGMKVLLHLAKRELPPSTGDQTEDADTGDEWPLSVELSSQTEHAFLLLPILNVLQSPDTSFIEIEAAVRSIAVMTSDLEPLDKELPAVVPEPVVEVTKSPIKGGAATAPTPTAPSIPELVITERDRFINAGLGCGVLVVLLALMDLARIPRAADDFSNRANIMESQIQELVQNFITLAQVKQENIVTKYREKLELEQKKIDGATPAEQDVDLNLPYQTRWSKLLDHKFSVLRFGYVNYSALLLASELALSNVVSTLLSAGASSETASPEGLTPLMIAFLVGNEGMVIDLLDARANVDAITTDGQDLTVWNCVLVSPVKARVSDLITKVYTNSDEVTTMNARIQLDSIEGSLQFLEMCLDAGVDANVSNAQGDFLLHALLSKSIVRRKLRGLNLCFRYNSCYENQRRLQRAVLDVIQAHSANVNSCNRMGQTPLHLALLYGYTSIAKILLRHGANPNVQGIYGHLPLHYACLGFCGNLDGSDGEAIEIIRLLLEQTAQYKCVLGSHTDGRKHKSAAEKQALAIENILANGLQSVIEPQAIVLRLANPQQILSTASFCGSFLPWHFACGAYIQLSSVLCLDDDMQKWVEANAQVRADILRYLIREWKIASSNHDTLALRLLNLPDISLDPEGSDLPLLALACAACNRPEVVKRLITQQANMRVHLPLRTSNCDLTAVDADTSTSIANRKHAAALHYAVMYDDFAMVEALLTSPGDHVLPNFNAAFEYVCTWSVTSAVLMKFDTLENDKLKELISENYLRPEMLLDGATMYVTARPNSAVSDSSQQDATVKSGSEIQANDGDDGDATSCALLREEQHNFDLFERLQNLNRERRASHEALTRRLETELDKSDAVLRLFFDLLQQPIELKEAQSSHLEIFQQLRHCHECYRQYTTRSQWKRKGKIPRAVSKSVLEELQQLEGELTQLHLRHAYNRAEIEGERRAVQSLEQDYASLIDQELELKRDCEVLELQLVALQVQNAEVENRQLEDEIRKLEEETSNLEAQYARDVQTKQQLEASLRDIQANYEQFKMRLSEPEHATHRGLTGISMINDTDKDKAGVLERLDSTYNIANKDDDQHADSGRTKTLVKEMLHWIERLQKHCGVNLHLSRVQCNLSIGPFGWSLTRPLFCDQIWHDVEEARVELNILHHQLDRAVRKTSMLPNILPNDAGVITIAATSPTSGSPSKRRSEYIMALGTHEAVPLFLRHRGKLKRRVLKKIDLFSWDSEIEMFLLCLTGAVSDLVYVDQEQMIQGCQQLLLRLCELYNVESFVAERRVLLKDALVALRTYFPLKTSAQLQAIEQAIIRDMHKMKRVAMTPS
ncbi:Ankyrin repeat-containing domain [Phytophthora cactorum]|nr:Ankyrin repeat-containing domain [Phytophthora cactorum]